MTDLDVPIALRRPRRSVVATAQGSDETTAAPLPSSAHPPRTPRRLHKAVRFSDPGPLSSTGLTPSVRRTCLDTPRSRRASTPSGTRCRPSPRAAAAPASTRREALPAPPSLRQTTDGRVERRIRRSNLRDLLNRLEERKKRSERAARSEIGALQAEIKMRDRDIYELQNATVVIDADRIWDLEQQVETLRDELQRRSDAPATPRSSGRDCYDWTLAARDPFADRDDEEATDLAPDEAYFGDVTMAQLEASTPSRARSSFPTPPATSPLLAATPCRRFPSGPCHAGVQASLHDPAKEQIEEELASLRLEVGKLTATLSSYQRLGERVSDHLSSVKVPGADAAPGIQGLERQIEGLLQAMSDRTEALSHLTSELADIGFPGRDAGDMLTALAAGFRAARLELEYLTPGELVLPLSSHGAEVLDLLLSRLRILAKKVQEDEATIDEYHEIEQSLHKQLDARVSVIQGLKAEMSTAEGRFAEHRDRIQELRVGNQRSGAVDGYLRDIAELEKLVEHMQHEAEDANGTHQARQQSDREALAAKEASIAELEAKLVAAMRRATSLQLEMNNVQEGSTRHVVALNKQHGAALALRDSRVLEMRDEIERLNEALRAAHETIRELRVEKCGRETRLEDGRQTAKEALASIKEELERVLQMSLFFGDSHGDDAAAADDARSSPGPGPQIRSGVFFAAAPVRRGSQKTPRSPDSGMALLYDDDVDV